MIHPLTKTFDFLATTSRPHAQEVLIAALDSPENPIRERAIEALLRRESSSGHIEIIRRYGTLSDPSREAVIVKAPRLKKAIEEALTHGDGAQRSGAAQLVLAAERFEHLTTLIRLLEHDTAVNAEWVMPVFRELVARLYDHCRPQRETRKTGSYLRDSSRVRRDILAAMESLWPKLEDREVIETVWEAILSLGGWESSGVKTILSHADEGVRQAGWDIITHSTQPGVMQLLCDALALSTPSPQTLKLLAKRTDPQFVAHLLRWLPNSLSATQRKNLRLVQSVEWLKKPETSLETIPEGLQSAVVRFVQANRPLEDRQLAIYEWLIRHGSLDARLAASEALGNMRHGLVQSFLFESLDSEIPEVQAWATSQLRDRQVPDAIPMLLDRLDSPIEEVREAARAELCSFDLQHALEWLEKLSPQACHRLGEMLQKIDPMTVSRLKIELKHPIQQRRLQAVHAAYTLNLHGQVAPTLLELLEDDDVAVRHAAAEVLGHVPSPEAIAGLQAVLNDSDFRVRETAEKSLKQIGELISQQGDAVDAAPPES